jgi:hypothetical protein
MEILVNVKSNDSPSLPLHLRCIGTPEEEWTPASALADLTRNVEAGLSAISAQKKKKLHWRTPESMPSMNNDVVFSGPAHSLLLKTSPTSTDRQTRKNTSASLLASPQVARKKKRYIKLDFLALAP